MDQNTNQPVVNNASVMNQPVMPGRGEKKVGPIVATLIIILVLIIAALYLFASRINEPAIPTDNIVSGDRASSGASAVPNSPEDINILQSDLDNSTSGLDDQNF